MSEEKKPSVFEMQMEINQLLSDRLDLIVKWNSELNAIVKTLSERLVALEGDCACKKGEM